MRFLFIVNVPYFFLSHRSPVARAVAAAGHEVHVATGGGPTVAGIEAMGFAHHDLPLSRAGRNPLREIVAFWAMWRLLRRLKPDVVHLVSIKPVIYGGITARLAGVPAVVAAISGMGTVFAAEGGRARLLRLALRPLYRLALGHRNIRVIFQNPDDRAALIGMQAVRSDQAVMIRGSGLALADFPALPEPEGTPVVAFAARLLREKGVVVFVEAARIMKSRGVAVRMQVIGGPDPEHPSAIPPAEVEAWQHEGVVEVLGDRADIAACFAAANVVALPSYYGEGLPKVLIEAASCGRAIVTTDHPGCRDAIEPGVTGLLVPPRDAVALADAIERLLRDPDLRQHMGRAGRKLAEREFAIRRTVQAHFAVYRAVLPGFTDEPG